MLAVGNKQAVVELRQTVAGGRLALGNTQAVVELRQSVAGTKWLKIVP